MKVFVIAEAGSCHDGDLNRAIRLIEIAKAADADAVKFQFWSSADRLADRRHADDYRDIYKRYQVPEWWLPELAAACAQHEIEFMCTAYLPEDVAIIEPYVQRFKIASFEARDLSFCREHAKYGKPIIISSGMMEKRPVHIHGDAEVWWLHCVSAYPTPLIEANLRVLHNGEYDGFSDHTAHVLTGAVATAAGAQILEVHFRAKDTSLSNPDYVTALSPGDLVHYILNVRVAQALLGDGIKRVMPSESEMFAYRVDET